MKYQNLSAFEKHLDQPAPAHLSRIFLLVVPCSYERKKIVETIARAIGKREGDLHLTTKEASPSSWEGTHEKLNTFSLFGGKEAIFLDGIDKLKKANLTEIALYSANPSPLAFLILGAASGKTLSEIYTKGKKEVIVCDLSDEKPWERKERLKRYLAQFAGASGKRIDSAALDCFLENVGLNLPALEQELFKVITYVGERPQVTAADVEALCVQNKSSTIWQMAESLVWKGSLPPETTPIDLSLLLPLISQLRSQIQQGLTLALLQEQGFGVGEISHTLPQLRSQTLEKLLPLAKAKRSLFFRKGLKALFEIELMAKNSSLEPGLLLDLFTAKLHMT